MVNVPTLQQASQAPVVSDCVGLLYNKDVVLQFLLPAGASPLNKQDSEKILQGRIKGLRDVVEVIFDVGSDSSVERERWVCPVTSKELGPSVRAVYLVPCGHAFSHEAIKEMRTNQCLQCNKPYETENVIPLFPSTEEEKDLQGRIARLSENGLTHSLKNMSPSSKKRKANKIAEVGNKAKESTPENSDVPRSLIPSTKSAPTPRTGNSLSRTSTPKPSNGINNAATAHLTAKVLEEEDGRKKQRLVSGENENLKSLFSGKKDEKKLLAGADFMTRGFSIPANARYD